MERSWRSTETTSTVKENHVCCKPTLERAKNLQLARCCFILASTASIATSFGRLSRSQSANKWISCLAGSGDIAAHLLHLPWIMANLTNKSSGSSTTFAFTIGTSFSWPVRNHALCFGEEATARNSEASEVPQLRLFSGHYESRPHPPPSSTEQAIPLLSLQAIPLGRQSPQGLTGATTGSSHGILEFASHGRGRGRESENRKRERKRIASEWEVREKAFLCNLQDLPNICSR